MPSDGAITFGDLVGRLDLLELVCAKCDRHGRYAVRRLIERHGGVMKVPDWKAEMTRDCLRRRLPGTGPLDLRLPAHCRVAMFGRVVPIPDPSGNLVRSARRTSRVAEPCHRF